MCNVILMRKTSFYEYNLDNKKLTHSDLFITLYYNNHQYSYTRKKRLEENFSDANYKGILGHTVSNKVGTSLGRGSEVSFKWLEWENFPIWYSLRSHSMFWFAFQSVGNNEVQSPKLNIFLHTSLLSPSASVIPT